MTFNPFDEKPESVIEGIEAWKKLAPKPYDKDEVHPFTKLRIILMNGNEYEAVWNCHQFARHCESYEVKQKLAAVRRIEQQQQKKIASLKPIDESILEHTMGYEQLAVELTAELARREKDSHVKRALDFALLEDFDHVYRYANLLELESGKKADKLLGKYTEITPARPTIAHHRCPNDSIFTPITAKKADAITRLNVGIITAAEQQTMNYYMNLGAFYKTELGRKLYTEIGMVEETHVSQYESLMDPTCSWFERLLEHEYMECYLYFSCYVSEVDKEIKKIWERGLEQELAHVHEAAKLLEKYEGKSYEEVLGKGEFPELLEFRGDNIDYVREVIKNTAYNTQELDNLVDARELKSDSNFKIYQSTVNKKLEDVASHVVIKKEIEKRGKDYRFEVEESALEELRDRTADNTSVGR